MNITKSFTIKRLVAVPMATLTVLTSVVVGATATGSALTQSGTNCYGRTYAVGSRGGCVKAVQILANCGVSNTSCLPNNNPDGIFGPKTAASVRAKQRATGLKADAIVGPKTWAQLCNINSSYPLVVKNIAKGAGCP